MSDANMTGRFIYHRRISFAETDMAGVLHFAAYYCIMEEAEHAFWRSIGSCVLAEVDGREISWPRVATKCEYFAPARFEDELELGLVVVKVGQRSITYEVEFRRTGERLAVGRTTAVCCATGRGVFEPIDIPSVLRTRLQQAIESGG